MEKTESTSFCVLTALLIIACLKVKYVGADDHSYHAFCSPRPTVIRVDPSQDRYYPFFVILNRCNGSCSTHPGNQRCEAISEEEVEIQVSDMIQSKPKQLIMSNHTTCRCRCVASFDSCHRVLQIWEQRNCRCICKYPEGPPKDFACQPGFIWVRDTCRCECNRAPEICPPGKVWSEKSCGCVCTKRVVKRCERKLKSLDYERCECVDVQALRQNLQEKSQSRMFITLLIGQGILLVVILCVLIHYVRKSKRATSKHEDQPVSPNPLQSHSDSGHISLNSSQSTSDALTSNGIPNFKSSDGSINIEFMQNGILKESTI